jgi:serine/threonine protein kinase
MPMTEDISPVVRRQIDSVCQRFESAWRDGQQPHMEDCLSFISGSARQILLRRLIQIELLFQQNSESADHALQMLISKHPELQEEIAAAREPASPPGELLRDEPVQDATILHSTSRGGSRGLHIRCPHCNNGVELLADTPFEDITCHTCGSTFNLAVREEATSAAAPLRRVGRFDLISRVGIGGFGTVWKARDQELDRVVAIKIPRKGQLNAGEIEQFFREARSAAQLRHPNIVPIHEVGRDQDTIFIVCDLVRGVSLSDWMTGQRPDCREVSQLCRTLAEALHHAHEHGVIHRDMKPSNIMIDESGEPHLMDFGLAKRETNEVTMTVDGQILGTPAYMSPEQAGGHGHWTDRRTDIYSLGVILFELLTGEQPFRGNAQMQVHQRMVEDAPDPRTLNRHIPRDLSTICLKCLERDPNGRYSNARLLADEFRRYLAGEPIQARPISRLSRFLRWCHRKPAVATAAALTLVLAIGGPLLAWSIEVHRQRLADLVVEKDNLIKRVSADKEASVNELSRLGEELDKWTGQSNPWELWPPKKEEGPRSTMIQRAYEKHYQSMVAQLEEMQSIEPQERASAQIGLALLADYSGHPSQALTHYEQARDTLNQLVASQPENRNYRLALADCLVQLSRLYGAEEKQAAEESLAAASALLEQLNAAAEDQAATVARVDTEMRRAVFAGFGSAAPQLAEAARLSEVLEQNWPTSPTAFYKLMNLLTERVAVLATETPDAEGG